MDINSNNKAIITLALKVIDQLGQDQEFTSKLQHLISQTGSGLGLGLTEELLVKILGSFNNTISDLSSLEPISSSLTAGEGSQNASCDNYGKLEDSGNSRKFLGPVMGKRGCYIRKKKSETWTVESNKPEDAFSWRKYGQKDILNANFPRSYFRCKHKYTQGCKATKQVQKLDVDPKIFNITYIGNHTCNTNEARIKPYDHHDEITMDSEENKSPSLAEELLVKILGSFNSTISDLSSLEPISSSSSSLTADEGSQNASCDNYGKFEDSGDSRKILGPVMGERGCYKRKKKSETWTVESNKPEDAFSWRKYGQKDILNANFPRSYFRCPHKFTQGCKATKQIQQIEVEPMMFNIAYIGNHICNTNEIKIKPCDNHDEITMDSEENKSPSLTSWWGWKWKCENVFGETRRWKDRVRFIKELAKEVVVAKQKNGEPDRRAPKTERMIVWVLPNLGWYKLNTNGASQGNLGFGSAGGVLRDDKGEWCGGFSLNIDRCSAPVVELWGVYYGLCIAWERRVACLEVEVDSEIVVVFLKTGITDSHPLSFLVRMYSSFLLNDWNVRISHVYKKANRLADGLANYALSLSLGFHKFDLVPFVVESLLRDDVIRFARP